MTTENSIPASKKEGKGYATYSLVRYSIHSGVPFLLSKRWILAYISSLGLTTMGLLRLNISIAIVCMVVDPFDDAATSGNRSSGDSVNWSNPNVSVKIHGEQHGKFYWDKSVQSAILSSYYYGYILVQLPVSWLATKFGVKHTMGLGVFISAMANLLIPVAARWNYICVVLLRFVIGAGTGTVYPCVQTLWPIWAPYDERSRLIAFSYMGGALGEMISLAISGFLCAYGFDNGWGSIFYTTGGVTMLWCLAWIYLMFDSPDSHPTISPAERLYIAQNNNKINQRKLCVPWRDIVRSRGLWANLIGTFCHVWIYITFTTSLPTFMSEVLHYDIKENGLVSSLPYICVGILGLISGYVADFLRTRYISTTWTRKILQTIDFLLGAGCIVTAGYLDTDNRLGTVMLITLGIGSQGIGSSALYVNGVDFALRYAGIVFGIVNTTAVTSGMIVPAVTGALTPDGTQEQWRNVFFICGGMALFGTVVFGLFAVGEPEPWAMRGDEDLLLDTESEMTYGDVRDFIGDERRKKN